MHEMQNLLACKSSQLKDITLDNCGVLKAFSTGESPYWLLKGLNIEKQYLHVRLRVIPEKDNPSDYYYCKLYFLEEGRSGFDEAHSLTLPIVRLGDFDDYTFKCLVFQQKKIVALRFQPFCQRGEISIESFGFHPYAQQPRPELACLSAKISPLLLSFYSRSGSTLMMKMLTQHPEITGYTRGTHEAHFIRYFSSLYDMIKASHIYSADHSDGTLLNRIEVLSKHYRPDCVLPKPFEFSQYLDLGIFRAYYSRFLSDFLPEMLSDMEVPGLQSARYYVEKHMDGVPFDWTRSMLELFPSLKIVMLFRDPRDVLISFEAFSKQERINMLKGDLAQKVENIMQHYVGRLKLHDEFPDRVYKIHYEDLMQKPAEVLLPMLDFLGIDNSEDLLEKMMQPLHSADLQSRRHITSGEKSQSIGRWRRNRQTLTSRLFEQYTEIITRLGYSVQDVN